jgi:predicted amidohydrolase
MAFSPASQSAGELSLVAEAVDGPFIATIRQAAQSAGIHVLAPIYETCAIKDRVYDSAVWIDAGGNIASVYRKLHLYDAFGFKESDKFLPGAEVAPLVQKRQRSYRHDDFVMIYVSGNGAHARCKAPIS